MSEKEEEFLIPARAKFEADILGRGEDYTGWVWVELKKRLEEKGIKPAEAEILDLACGPGRSTRGLYKEGFTKVIGVDADEGMVKDALKKKDRIPYKLGSSRKLPADIADESLDVVTIYSAFNYFGNDEKSMEEIRRVLKPGGICMVITEKVGKFTERGRQLIALYKRRDFDPNPHAAPVGESSADILKNKYGFKEVNTYTRDVEKTYTVEKAIQSFEGARGRMLMDKEDFKDMENELKKFCEKEAKKNKRESGEELIKKTDTLIVDIAVK